MPRISSPFRFRSLRRWTLAHPLGTFLIAGAFVSALFVTSLLYLDPSDRRFAVLNALHAGLLTSLLSYALVRYLYLQRSTEPTREWLGFSPYLDTKLVVPYQVHPTAGWDPDRPYYVVSPFDARAIGYLTHIVRAAGFAFPQREMMGSHRQVDLTANLVLTCLPERNRYVRGFLGLLYDIHENGEKLSQQERLERMTKYLGDENCSGNYFGMRRTRNAVVGRHMWEMKEFGADPDHEWFEGSIDKELARSSGSDATADEPLSRSRQQSPAKKDKIPYDYAMVLKAPNPLNRAAGLLIVCGLHGIGTFGAALYLYDNANELFRTFPAKTQRLLLRIEYTTSAETGNYVDADIVRPIKLVEYRAVDG